MAPSHVIISINCVPYVKTQTNSLIIHACKTAKNAQKHVPPTHTQV